MADLEKMAAQYVDEGYTELLAEARVCQDIVLKAISESSMNRNVTIKGGVVMRSITGDVRRATRDIDFDFIKYSIDESAIRDFIDKLNVLEGITMQISGEIEELSQQEYRGKRVWVVIRVSKGTVLFDTFLFVWHCHTVIILLEYPTWKRRIRQPKRNVSLSSQPQCL